MLSDCWETCGCRARLKDGQGSTICSQSGLNGTESGTGLQNEYEDRGDKLFGLERWIFVDRLCFWFWSE
jgi:hypothetical protein